MTNRTVIDDWGLNRVRVVEENATEDNLSMFKWWEVRDPTEFGSHTDWVTIASLCMREALVKGTVEGQVYSVNDSGNRKGKVKTILQKVLDAGGKQLTQDLPATDFSTYWFSWPDGMLLVNASPSNKRIQ